MEIIVTLSSDIQGNPDSTYTISTSDDQNIAVPVDEATDAFYHTLWTIVSPILFALIIVIGTAGNFLVIYVILSRPAMQTATNYLLINLAFSDMAFLLICVPVTAYKFAATTWPFGDATCKVVTYVIYVTAYVTVYTLVAVSLLRYLTIVHNTYQYFTRKNVIGLNLLIWIVVLIVNIPTLLTHQLKEFGEYYAYCGIVGNNIKGFFLSFFLAGYLIPLTLISALCITTCIISHLNNASASVVGQTRRITIRASNVISQIVIVFALSWLPLHVNQMWSSFGHIQPGKVYEVFRILIYCMAYSNSCVNPIIYNFVSSDFRNSFKEVICCKKIPVLRPRNETETVNNTMNTTERITML